MLDLDNKQTPELKAAEMWFLKIKSILHMDKNTHKAGKSHKLINMTVNSE